MGKFYLSLFRGWCFTTNNAWLDRGRIIIAWDPSVFTVDIRICTSQLIHCLLQTRQKDVFYMTRVYAFNEESRRRELWRDLESIAQKIEIPWLVAGDFNDVMELNERTWRQLQRRTSDHFKICVQNCLLEDIKSTSCLFTWNNKQKWDNRVWAKLDRALVNKKWQDKFESTEAVFLPEGCFDHSPIVISSYQNGSRKRIPFCYFKMWSFLPNFREKLKENWEPEIEGVPMFRLVAKLRRLKGMLKQMNRRDFANIQVTGANAKAEMIEAQENLHRYPTNEDLLEAEVKSRSRYIFLQKAYISFLSQKAKLEWVRGGDENTTIFHSFLKVRHKRNTINSVRDIEGNWQDTFCGFREAFLVYYKKILGSNMIGRRSVIRKIVQLGPILSNAQRHILQEEYQKQEVKNAVFNILELKVPGPDRYSSAFFRDNWEIVGEDVEKAILSFLSTGRLLKELNATSITLIPKSNCRIIDRYRVAMSSIRWLQK